MYSNSIHTGTELNVDISNINSLFYSDFIDFRFITITHEKFYDQPNHCEGGYSAPYANSGFVMSNYDAESRCRYLNEKYRVINIEIREKQEINATKIKDESAWKEMRRILKHNNLL